MNPELYQKILPALKTKVSNLKIFGYNFIDEDDILSYLMDKVWLEDEELAIDEIIADVLNTPNYLIKDYLIDNIKNKNKKETTNSLL